MATGFTECNSTAAVTLIVIGVGLSGLSMAGWGVNHLDLAPAYAGRVTVTLRIVIIITGIGHTNKNLT